VLAFSSFILPTKADVAREANDVPEKLQKVERTFAQKVKLNLTLTSKSFCLRELKKGLN
jgi:hypothetical protein